MNVNKYKKSFNKGYFIGVNINEFGEELFKSLKTAAKQNKKNDILNGVVDGIQQGKRDKIIQNETARLEELDKITKAKFQNKELNR